MHENGCRTAHSYFRCGAIEVSHALVLHAVNRRMDEWVKLDNLNLNTVDVADIEGPDSKG